VSPARRRLLALALAATALGSGVPAAGADAWKPTPQRAQIARVVAPAVARAAPDAAAPVRWRVPSKTSWTGASVRLLVLASARDGAGHLWLRVRLPVRPNRSSGWLDSDFVRTAVTRWRVVVHTRSRTVAVYRKGRLARRFGAVVGKPSTPTPHGRFAVWERDRQPDPAGFLGPWALHLSAHSEVLENFGGGPGRVAIHGRAGASLADPLGSARSHGCVRVDDADVRWLARIAVAGTPVRVTR
jgi:lipoprotein-anchoring transpeptidase ErfK/SrfK